MHYDVIIIGCGVVGAACAYELSKFNIKVGILEADNDIANGTTKANSAIIHAGYDPLPGTKMARLNVLGNRVCEEICNKLDVPFQRIGSLVLAFDSNDLETLQVLFRRGLENGVPGLRIISRDEVKCLEPGVADNAVGALLAPTAGIINPWEFCFAMAETAVKNGAALWLNSPVTGIRQTERGFLVKSSLKEYSADYVINCAGVSAEAVTSLVCDPGFHTFPTKGEYYLLDKSEGARISHIIFRCPTPSGKGVLITPTVHGNLLVGPSAEVSAPDDTSNTSEGMRIVKQSAEKAVPGIDYKENIRNFAGVRANTDRNDFIIEECGKIPRFFQAAGIRSPGLTAAPAIALEMKALLQSAGLDFTLKQDYIDSRRRIRFAELSDDEKQKLVRNEPLYGRVICRCESITEGEIAAALHTCIPPVSVNGLKRRVGAGMGRCQGGFCGPRVQEIIARETGIKMTDIPLESPGSYILSGESGGGSSD